MKLVVNQDRFHAVVQEGIASETLRIGQHVTNTFLTGTMLEGEKSARLFYCPDCDFWDIVFDYFELTNES